MNDVTFIVGSDKVRIAANKTLLALSNEVFRKQFFGQFDEGSKDEVIIRDTNPVAFKNLISFLNFGQTNFDNEIVNDVYELAERYLDEKLKDVCADQINSMINYKNVFSTITWNHFLENEKIKASCIEYFKNNSMACLFSDKEGFNTLHKDRLHEIVSMKVLNCSEELLLQRVLEWREANEDHTIDDLLPYIRLEINDEYKIADFFSKTSRVNMFDKPTIGELKIAEELVFSKSFEVSPAYCIGFSIILSNIERLVDYVEEFNVFIINTIDSFVMLNRNFITTIEECVVIQEHIFDFPLFFDSSVPGNIKCEVTFKNKAKRYHHNNCVLFPYNGSLVPFFEEIYKEENFKKEDNE